jgi:DNA-binding transcriptional MocR family regulator
VSTATVTQLAAAEFLRAGGYERHLKRLRAALRRQVEFSRYAIGRCFPAGTRVSRPQGGFFLWVELPAGTDAEGLFQRALDAGVSIMPGTVFSPTRKYRNCIRISCGLPWSERVEAAIETVGRLAGE